MTRRTRVAGAPITWGVCEVAGWGHQLPAERVLREAAAAGLRAMEIGPPGFLPADPKHAARLLAAHGLKPAGGFLAIVLHCPEQQEDAWAAVDTAAHILAASGGHVLAIAAAAPPAQCEGNPGVAGHETGAETVQHETLHGAPERRARTRPQEPPGEPVPHQTPDMLAGHESVSKGAQSTPAASSAHRPPPVGSAAYGVSLAGTPPYEGSGELSPAEWSTLLVGLDRARKIADRTGVTIALHPHYGTMIARRHHVARVLETSDVPLCLDTGHLLLGGVDPLDIVREAATRIVHVHLKDVDADMAGRVRRGEIEYRSAVSQGLYRPLGAGDVDVRGVIDQLQASAYRGWYVLEHDTVLTDEPPEGSGPAAAALRSLEFLNEVISGAAP